MSDDGAAMEELAAQARAYRPLNRGEISALLGEVRALGPGPAHKRLVEHSLGVAVDAARARAGRGVDMVDLYQEATLALTAAILEYAATGADADGLRPFIGEAAGRHLEEFLEAAALEREADEAFVRDAQLYETAELGLRHRFGRPATSTEIASVLEWPPDRVELVGRMLSAAREMYDTEIVQYLDDEER